MERIMGQILHKCAKTTHRTRAEIQQSKESVTSLSQKFGVAENTIRKWKKRTTVEDQKMGSHKLRTVLTPKDEAMICAFRKKTELSLDDCFIALTDFIPKLTRSNLHRCLKRHGLSVLPKHDEKPKRDKFKEYEIGFFHIDICQIQTEEGKCYLFVGIDRVTKFAYAEVYSHQTAQNAAVFLENLIKIIPYKIHRILTDNGAQFSYNILMQGRSKPKNKTHIFDMVCKKHDIFHKTTQFYHPWTNGQVERMNRTIKEATIKQYHYSSQSQFKQHLYDFLNAYNFAKKLKALKFKSPFDFILDKFKQSDTLFLTNPLHHSMGLNT